MAERGDGVPSNSRVEDELLESAGGGSRGVVTAEQEAQVLGLGNGANGWQAPTGVFGQTTLDGAQGAVQLLPVSARPALSDASSAVSAPTNQPANGTHGVSNPRGEMPRIVNAGGTWRSVHVPGELAVDSNFQFLSAFEELSPLTADKPVGASHTSKLERKKRGTVAEGRSNDVQNAAAGTEATNGKAKAKKKKKRGSGPRRRVVDEKTISTETEGVVEEVDEGVDRVQQSSGNEVSAEMKEHQPTVEVKQSSRKASKHKRHLGDAVSGDVQKKRTKLSNESSEHVCAEENASQTGDANMTEEFDLSQWNQFCFPEQIMKALRDCRFSQPTEIQSVVLPSALRDRMDILGAAETGSGKTLAYAIPMVARLLEAEKNSDDRRLKALVLSPTRELGVQIKEQIDAILKYTKFKSMAIVGGLSQQKQERLLQRRPAVVVATPGRLWALLQGGAASESYLRDWSSLACVVVDEADRMVEKGHFEELQHILDLIKSDANEKRQTMVFSATLTFVHPAPKRLGAAQTAPQTRDEKIKRLVEITGLRKQRKVFDVTRSFGTAESLVEARINCDSLADKDTKVIYLLTRFPGRTLVFLNSIDASRRLRGILDKLNYRPLMLHAKMIQKRRLSNLETFAGDERAVLLATDVAARGLDISGVQHVIHYQVPKTAELYVHRSGRTARASHKGLTVLMVDPQDIQYYRRICRNLNREKELPVFPVDSPELLNAVRMRVRCASDVESLEHRMKKISVRENWFEKTAREADLLLDERDQEKENSNEELIELRRLKRAAEARLKQLLLEDLSKFCRQSVQKSRYVTPELAADFEKRMPADALSIFEENAERETEARRKTRTLVNTRHMQNVFKNDRRKRKKLKRK